MYRPLVSRSLGIAAASLVVLSVGILPALRAGQAPAVPVAASAVGGGIGVAEVDPLERAPVVHLAARPMSPEATRIWLKLQEKVPMSFPNDTPLSDVIKYIRSSTKDKDHFAEGIPIYVDPVGLNDADKTISSTVSIDLDGIPLATTFRLVLKQIGLAYEIENDGFLKVTSAGDEPSGADADALILDNLAALRAEVKALRADLHLLRGPEGHMGSVGGRAGQPEDPKMAPTIGGGFR